MVLASATGNNDAVVQLVLYRRDRWVSTKADDWNAGGRPSIADSGGGNVQESLFVLIIVSNPKIVGPAYVETVVTSKWRNLPSIVAPSWTKTQ